MNTRRSCLVLALAIALAACLGQPLRAAELDDAGESAVFLIRQSMQVSRDGRHNLLLRALRQLADPAMEPLFNQLIQSEHPSLKIHGMLGLAECHPERKLDLVRVAAIEQAAVQAELISAAMDIDLLSNDQAKQLAAWPGLDNAVKIVVAQQLVKDKALADNAFLKESAKSESVARRGLAFLLLLQSGDASAANGLAELSKSTDARRDPTREMLLQSALRYDYDAVGPWAASIAGEQGLPNSLLMVALRASIRFNAPGAADAFVKHYNAPNANIAQKTRLAITALQVANYADPKIFEPLAATDDVMIKDIAAAGAAIARHENSVGAKAVALLRHNHPIVSDWTLQYARKFATEEDARTILLALINAVETGPERNKAQRVDDAVAASQILYERKPAEAGKLLRPLLLEGKAAPMTQQAILVGLIRSKPSAHALVADLPPYKDSVSANLVLLTLARSGQKLTSSQLSDLGLIVRGGSELMGALRVQAAWIYLRVTNQLKPGVAQILGQ